MRSLARFLILLGLILAACTGEASAQRKWADTLISKALTEPTLQQILDSLGYSIDVANDELGWQVLCGRDGINTATMVIEVAGSAVYATSGYYKASDTSVFYQLFGPTDGPGDSVTFSFSTFDSIGFYMKPNLPNNNERWFSQNLYNDDGYDHMWIFPTGVPHEYVIAWEDLVNGGDEDHNDLVIKLRFANFPPVVTLPADTLVTTCNPGSICFDVDASDPNCQGDSIFLTKISGPGSFSQVNGLRTISTQHCFTPSGSGTYTFVFRVVDILGASDQDTIVVTVSAGSAPVVIVNDTTITRCTSGVVCLPVSITDPDCDITSVTSTPSAYSGNDANFDQIANLISLGGSVTQVGGTGSGNPLYDAGDFSGTVSTTTGVTVTLPNFVFGTSIVSSSGLSGSTNQPSMMLGTPTDLTYTLPGPGGPDGTDGDGSCDFDNNDNAVISFGQLITSCNGARVDAILFTNTGGGSGTAEIRFRNGGTDVHTIASISIPAGAAGSGTGGITFDIPDGITFNRIRVKRLTGTFDVDAVAARIAPSSSTSDICFNVDTSGVYTVSVTATDACGHVTTDNAQVTVNINRPPVASAGADFTRFQCSFAQICFPVSFTDPDGNLSATSLVSGPGSLSGSQICFTPVSTGAHTFVIQATDACGLTDRDTVVVTVNLNSRPVAVDPSPVTLVQCSPTQACYQFAATDPNGGTLTWTKLTGAGTITSAGLYCFTPTISGTYPAAVVVTDSCGASDTTTITFNVTVNVPPVATNPSTPVSLFQCTPTQVCYQFAATDNNGGTLTWTKLSGAGTITTAGLWCFTPVGSGAYSINAVVSDSCGAKDTTTLTYNVTINGAPTLAFGADTSVFLCTPQQICVSYSVSDPQGLAKLTEAMLSGFGAIDTLLNKICFTPATAGVYQFVAQVTDSCGSVDTDTINVTVGFGTAASITCPSGPIAVSLCAPGTVCQMLDIQPSGASVTTNLGTYSGGQLCFTANTSGTYNAQVIASTSCGVDTCNLVFNVTIGQAAQISCPATQNVFLCQTDSVCIPVGVVGAGASVTVSPVGVYTAGSVCFLADTAGSYLLTVIASTTCGSDTCQLVVNVTKNSAPVAVQPPTPVDTFLCLAAQICRTFSASDVNGGTLTWSRLSGAGTVTSGGQWCFTPAGSGVYTVTAAVTDSCGAADTISLSYNVTINSAPVLAFGPDTAIFICSTSTICFPYTLSDANNNVQTIAVTSGTATLDIPNNRICATYSGGGSFSYALTATDSCGASDVDTINVTVTLNSPPVVNAGADQTIFQCSIAQICWPVSASDPNGNLTSVQLITGPGTYNGSQICFTPSGTLDYEFVLKATDACGAVSYDTVVIYYTLNTPPVANAGPDQTLFQCTPTQVCWPVSCSDINGNLTNCALLSGPGVYNGSTICFTPATSGVYTFVLEATDACGSKDRDTAVITVTINSAPVCVVPNDTSIFQCAPTQICLPAYATDANGNLQSCQIISGPGSLIGTNWCYTPSVDQTVTVSILCTDSCGATCTSSFTVEIGVNAAPTITFGADTSLFLCAPQQVCIPYASADADFPRPVTISLISGPGTLDTTNSQVCFTPGASGSTQFIVSITDECGATDRDTINVSVTLNVAPVASAGPNQTIFLCDSTETVCWPASCSDANGNLSACLFNGPGTYNGSQICLTPASSGAYLFTLRAEDSCGAFHVDTVIINVTLNSTPVVTLGNDTTIQLCTPQQLCFPYSVADANGLAKIQEFLVSGAGSIDTLANTVCFTPPLAGLYEFVVRAQDSCGDFDLDTLRVTITFGAVAQITCPAGPVDVSLCAPGQVCYLLPITPGSASVTTTLGTYSGGQLCFTANSSGVYTATVIATSPCGADTCAITFNVDIGSAAEISCPGTQNVFLCATDTICVPVTVMGVGASVTVSPIGYYSGGNVCVPISASGSYAITVIASTTCGADTCSFTINATLNSNPVADAPPASIDTFLCIPAQICRQFTATDVNGGTLTWIRLSGAGTVTSGGLWCFTPSTSGSYTVVAAVIDSCGAADTVSSTYNVTLNSAPVVSLGTDTTVFQCTGSQICVSYSASDPNNNITTETLVSGPGTINTTNNTVCFTPGAAGVYTIVVSVTDACGFVDTDTVNVTVQLNLPPVANAGPDSSLFLCNAGQICVPVSATDPNNNLSGLTLISGPGSLSGSTICFTPGGSGSFTFVIQATDACGATDRDTVVITTTLNQPPVCNLPNDTTFFQCTQTQVSLPVGAIDPNGNFSHCEIISGPGNIVAGNWVFTPTTDQSVLVKIQCLDLCGAGCVDSFRVTFDINTPPVANAGKDTTFFLCNTGQICWPASCTDVDNNLTLCELVAGNGTYSNGQICFNVPTGERNYQFVLKATDACGATDYDTVVITIDFNEPPTVGIPPNFTAYLDSPGETCFDANVSDQNNNLSSVSVFPFGTYSSITDQICFDADSSGEYCFVVTATDACGSQTIDTVCITIEIDECIHVQIEKTHNTFQGMMTEVDIFLNGSGKSIGGYDLLIAYDQTALSPVMAVPGSAFLACTWEYFTFRFGPFGNCGSACPSGQMRIVAIAESNNGAYHPDCFLEGQLGSLATIQFLVSNDRNLECQYAPIRFFWYDCGDNSFSSQDGDTLYVSREVYDFEFNNITNNSFGFPGFYGAHDSCLVGGGPGKPRPIRCVDFTNGGVDIVCADSIDGRGDINLNFIAYEVGDAVLFSNYFVFGPSVFDINVQGQIAATEVNGDGLPLTVADLVYIIRVITGDAQPNPKLDPEHAPGITFTSEDGVLVMSQSDENIGAIYLLLDGDAKPTLADRAAGMEIKTNFDGTNTRVLIYSSAGTAFLSGDGPVLNLNGKHTVKEVEAGTFEGVVMNAKLAKLPTRFALRQNYPNPFNPKTVIQFEMPRKSEYTLTIYNVLGQTVQEWEAEADAGVMSVEWDAGQYASGVYFYRLKAGSFTDTKKMVLVK